MKHVFSVAGLGLATAFVVVFFTGRIDSKHLTVVAPRVGMNQSSLQRTDEAVIFGQPTEHLLGRRCRPEARHVGEQRVER